MITPPLNISASPAFTLKVASSRMGLSLAAAPRAGSREREASGLPPALNYLSRKALMRSSYWALSCA